MNICPVHSSFPRLGTLLLAKNMIVPVTQQASMLLLLLLPLCQPLTLATLERLWQKAASLANPRCPHLTPDQCSPADRYVGEALPASLCQVPLRHRSGQAPRGRPQVWTPTRIGRCDYGRHHYCSGQLASRGNYWDPIFLQVGFNETKSIQLIEF